jgi:type II secretory pathway pseudopilin PulG
MKAVMANVKGRAFSLVEAVIAIFLLSFAALSVLSLTQSGFVAQKRNQEIAKANLVIQSVVADMRLWASDINNYKSSWALYNRTFSPPGFPEYQVRARSRAGGRPIDSPCAELETQWEPTPRGKRTMPNAVVPVELTVFWSADPRDSLSVLTYVGEPKRDVTGITFEVSGPSRLSMSMNSKSNYQVRAKDSNGRYLDNLMFQWVPDIRYVSTTEDAKRDGRYYEIIRDQIVQLPDVPAPKPPAVSSVTCYARYAGTYLDAGAGGVELP